MVPNAKADMCFGGPGEPDEDPSTAGTAGTAGTFSLSGASGASGASGEAGEAGEAGARSALQGIPTRRYAGGSLMFVGALGSIWLVARRKSGSPRPE